METNVGQDRNRFNRRTIKWLYIAFVTASIAIITMLATGWTIESAELFVVTSVSLIITWLVVTIWQSRGRFRIVSMLVLCTVVALLVSTLLPRMRTAAAHRRLMTEVTRAGGFVSIVGGRSREMSGWVMSSSGIVLPKLFSPVLNYLEGGAVDQLHVPAYLIDRTLFDNSKFSKRPRLTLVLEGKYRDYEAIRKLIAKASTEILEVECSRLSNDDAQFLAKLQVPFFLTYKPDAKQINGNLITVDQMRLAISAGPEYISFETGVVIDDTGWEIADLQRDSELSIIFHGQNGIGKLLASLQSNDYPTKFSLNSCQLDDADWTSISNLDHVTGLGLRGCSPTENQLSRLLRMTTLEYLQLTEPNISDACLRQLSKLGRLKQVNIPFVQEQETLRCFLVNNPRLESISCPRGIFEGNGDMTIVYKLRRDLEILLGQDGLPKNGK